MFKIGCHISASNGYYAMGQVARTLGANTFAYFSRNPRGGSVRALDEADIAKFLDSTADFAPLVVHAPYTFNACAADENLRQFAKNAMREDLERLEYMQGNYYNFHPGSHVKQGADVGIELIAQLLNSILTPNQHTTVLLETMAGKGSEVGRTFEELRAIIDRVDLKDKLGVCLDTCHVWDGGYDIVGNLDGVLEEFDAVIGLERLKAIHINDSMNPLGAHKDRHAKIGEGAIGLDALVRVINHPLLRELPFVLETPTDDAGHGEEIKLLKGYYKE